MIREQSFWIGFAGHSTAANTALFKCTVVLVGSLCVEMDDLRKARSGSIFLAVGLPENRPQGRFLSLHSEVVSRIPQILRLVWRFNS
jgi:hypothetical protein